MESSSHGPSSEKVDYLISATQPGEALILLDLLVSANALLRAFAIPSYTTCARVWNETRWVHFDFAGDAGESSILVQQHRRDLLVDDFPVVVFVWIFAQQCLHVFREPAKVWVVRLLNVGDVAIRDGDVEVVGLGLMIHLEVFDLEGELFGERLRISSGGACKQQYKDYGQGAHSHHGVLSFVRNLAADARG